MTSENVVLGLALILTVVGLAGLAPALFGALRRKRLLAQLASLKVDEDRGFATIRATPEETHESVEAIPEQPPISPAYVVRASAAPRDAILSPYVGAPAPAERTVPETPLRSVPLPSASERVSEVPTVEVTLDPEGSPEALSKDDAGPGDEVEPTEDQDENDLLAMFKDAQVKAAIPEALTEAIEPVAVADLLSQARELRDLLRRAA